MCSCWLGRHLTADHINWKETKNPRPRDDLGLAGLTAAILLQALLLFWQCVLVAQLAALVLALINSSTSNRSKHAGMVAALDGEG